MSYISLAALVLAAVPLVAGHGQVNRVQAGSTSNQGPNQYWSGDSANSKTVTRVMYKAASPSYVLFGDFDDNSKMSCEASAKSPAPMTLKVSAGQEIEVYWEGATSELKGKAGTGSLGYNPWVHAMGFVFDYITSCNGDCTTFDATNVGWTKIAHSGLDMSQTISSSLRETMKNKPEEYFPTSGAGLWGMAKLIQNGSKWSIKIPSALKSGQYMIRHELGAVHNPKTSDPTSGPQLYIACIQLDVVNGGESSLPAGTQAKHLYLTDGAFANIDVYSDSFNPAKVEIPGPAIWEGVYSSTSHKAAVNTNTNTTTTAAKSKDRRSSIMKRNVAARRAHIGAQTH
ncbi:glycosyl hydrolase family 61-domain-containing protein [Mycena amicta]|nr:glycosyl hydrolase family 61-domain-containing protein [Mycena amicta]